MRAINEGVEVIPKIVFNHRGSQRKYYVYRNTLFSKSLCPL